LGLFNFLYRLKTFWIISRIVNLSIGIFSIILGILSLYDFLKIIKQGRAEGLALQLPNAVKGRIHAVIGWHFRKPRNAQEKPVKVHILRLVITSLATGFLVSILEAICTGQVYLPTIIFVLKTTPLKLPALGYLLFYNLLFIAPLFIIFVFALLGVTSEQFARLLKKHLLSVKLLLALVFFLLGFVLIHTQIPRSPLAEGYQEDSLVWDAGRAQEGAVLEHSFALKNASRNLWHIKNINTSCGCTTSEVKKKILLPGEATSINVRFNTQGYSGNIQQYVYVYVDILDAAAASKVKIEDVPPIDNQIIRFIIKAYLAK